MYFFLTKRRMVTRVGSLALTILVICGLYFHIPQLQHLLCTSSGHVLVLGYTCSTLTSKSWNLLEHLGGNGPWIPRTPEGYNLRLPLGCKVDQVHMLARHAERYPTVNAGNRHLSLLKRLKTRSAGFAGILKFVNEWEYFVNASSPQFEELTTEGPYAGTYQAYQTGLKLRKEYNALVDFNRTTNFWTCASNRDIDTARHFANGFFGTNWEDSGRAKLHVISESVDRGANTLTSGDTCVKYIEDKIHGHDRGYNELSRWQEIFAKPIAVRLAQEAPGLTFSPLEIYSMMEMCGFEILAKGSSPWCEVFSQREWLDFEYGRDLLHFYRAGPGNEYAGVMGWLWLNATTTLLSDDETKGVYFSFVHDGDIIPLMATLGILDEAKTPGFLPNHKLHIGRRWKTSDVVPMGGRLILEKVTCQNTGLGSNLRRSYVRLFINDGIVDLARSTLAGGLTYSVGMAQWRKLVYDKGQKYGDFKKVCGLSSGAPDRITFLQAQYL